MNDNISSAGSDLPRFAVSVPCKELEYLIPNHEEQCDFCREKKIKDGEESWSQSTTVSEPIGVEVRLRRIENSLELLTNSVNQLLVASGSRTAPASNESGNLTSAPETERRLPEQIHTFSSLDEAARILQSFQDKSGPSPEHQQAQSSLQGLSDALTNVSLHHGTADETAPGSRFYIPTKETGYALMGQFLKHSELGDFMFLTPSDEILCQVLFEPETVSAKAWVVYVNYMLLALTSGSGDHAGAVTAFRKNMRLALDDAKIFLEPSEVNIQTLILLALHGEDFALPNMSWMLTGQACQQAQVLRLHSVTNSDASSPGQQRRLCLFWALFMADKSCSLAFGRPVFLPTEWFQNVPLPHFEYLEQFHAHQSQAPPATSAFGAYLFLQTVQFSKLIGFILVPKGASSERDMLNSLLDSWYQQTHELLSQARDSETGTDNTTQCREMSLGLLSVQFRYLTACIILQGSRSGNEELRIAYARQAISLLPNMVSNWNQVYNPAVWELLYFPFTPFFVLFGSIMRDPSALTVPQDLELLATTKTYFSRMRTQLCVLACITSKLEYTAGVFLTLARERFNKIGSGSLASKGLQDDMTSPQPRTITDQGQAGFSFADTQDNQQAPTLGDVDIEAFLHWLPQNIPMQSTADVDMEGEFVGAAPNQETRGMKRSIDSTFDWFSWDTYYASGTIL
ncbi:Zn(2)-C6 fungal-type domain-containing protein [Fusarium falciforme]|uniref:Zn(2)-C6 fungal-type domain-containing protein n=1 Tax=Fusarium falciforme TaxID=195108 RepID=UPI0023002714|nr:Zn(2)-C6 fungal-type domain-containing protein [Fusarium falciforme]WAO84911.1 Zn(2)-C6 fungal-type domain-containing protein [Fusarium falciforme]